MNIELPHKPPVDEPPAEAPPDEGKIIDLRGNPLEIEKAKTDPVKYCLSNHKAVFVDEHDRIVYCKECGKTIEAFDYIMGWAREGERRMQRLKSLDDEIRITFTKLEDVKKALAREKAKVRRVNPDAPEVVTWQRQLALRKGTA